MQIKKIQATFGCLQQKELQLHPGMNVIYAPNESGKSTWNTLLRVMFYGLDPSRKGGSPEKERFLPWSGSPMQGVMDVDDITIARLTTRANSPMGTFSATYQNTATPVPGLTDKNCGETLLGISREVFERSMYVQQSTLPLDQGSGDLSARIQALVTSGDESVSYAAIKQSLTQKQNQRKLGQNRGTFNEVNQRIAALENERDRVDQITALLQEELPVQESLSRDITDFRQKLDLHRQADEADRAAKAAQAYADYRRIQGEATSFENLLSAYPSLSELETRRADARFCQETLLAQRKAAQTAEEESRKAKEAAEEACRKHPFFGKDLPALREKMAEPVSRPRLSFGQILLILAVVAGVLLLTHYVVPLSWVLSSLCGIGAGLIPLTVCLLLAGKHYRALRKTQQESLAQFDRDAAVWTQLSEERSAKQTQWQEASAHLTATQKTIADRETDLCAYVSSFHPSVSDISGCAAALDHVLALYQKLSETQSDARVAKAAWESYGIPASPDPVPAPPERPLESPAFLSQQLAHAEQQLKDSTKKVQQAEGELRSYRSRDDLEKQLQYEKEIRERIVIEMKALTLASELLESANQEMQNRFSPQLGLLAGSYYSRLTGGKYDQVLVKQNFGAEVKLAGDMVTHEENRLSRGAEDQLYLALRLAFSHCILPEEKNLPLIFDDAFVNFDIGRLQLALDCLWEEAEHRQILLFTCHEREADYLRGRDHVHCVSLV